METMIFTVEGMACEKCTARIEATLTKMDGVQDVACDLSANTITVNTSLSQDEIAESIEDMGFDIV